jgi:3-oxoacyl-[acyl-carrier protein] reductase
MVHLIEERASKTGTTVEEAYKELVKSIPLGRYGEPEEVGYLAAFIASERGSYLTGGMFTVDGGVISSVF